VKYLKKYQLFEENSITQQPLFLTTGGRLYVSDDFAKFLTEYGTFKDNSSGNWKKLYSENNKEFFSNIRKPWIGKNGSKFNPYQKRYAYTNLTVRYDKGKNFKGGGIYAMNIMLYRGANFNNDSGKFNYYVGGRSGDFEMYGKNMIWATRNSIFNLICKFFPIFFHIKDGFKKLKGENFYQLIEDEVDKDVRLENHLEFNYTKGLDNYPDIESKCVANKYNL